MTPSIKAAGKLTSTGDTVEICLKPPDKRPESASIIRRFRATFRPDVGVSRVFYGKTYDPQLKWAAEMRHGVNTHPSLTSGELVHPRPKTVFQQKIIDRKESAYASHVRAPLGVSYDQSPGLPNNLDTVKHTFGIPSNKDLPAGEIINPNKTYAEVEQESEVGHDMYVFSHKDYHTGEHVNRSYYVPQYNSSAKFGKPTPHENDGRKTWQSMKWACETDKDVAAHIISKRLDDFREKTQSQIGQGLDPIKDTLNVGPDHTFGLLIKPDEYGAGDLVHNRVPGKYLRGRDWQRGLVAAMRQQLKKFNYQHFADLIHSFQFYDKEGKGKIDIEDLRMACEKFDLPVDTWLLEQVIDYCDVDRDGKIDYIEFSNFLNWKDRLPQGFAFVSGKPVLEEAPKDVIGKYKLNLSGVGDSKPLSPKGVEETPRRLQKQIDHAIGQHHTSAGMINAVVGPDGIDTRFFRTYGIPSIRADLPAPRLRRLNDMLNYGDESSAYGLTNPSIYSQHGVYEKELLIPRTSEELKEIFGSMNVHMTGDIFETLYKEIASQHPKGHVSVEAFRNALDEFVTAQIVNDVHPLSV
ncbi:hypothetical protein C0Q70_00347 [Pomacea canaliculata]|uniref:EF-hand domain-containing protein n=2 Tax=Pomacea canaliculata TaxID=400727 RepID=A0A2T7PWD5_POMCA|nr:hypothetical protein C0Q70_00347 [Pomacea canaliculata]